ncbi:MAG: 3-hydroxyacyl-CoA dehydrogenase family protein [Saprospiraceae bacterium]|nr:3-hydroxyacyl-CoA dehydrogenase family protein [Saprospiraceae bacterium]
MGNKGVEVVGVIGLGFMGCSIVAALLLKDQQVVAVAPLSTDLKEGPGEIEQALLQCLNNGFTDQDPKVLMENLEITEDYSALAPCTIVIETVIEDLAIKKSVLEKVESVVADDAIITSNTSAIPISTLQKFLHKPHRFYGMHWAEPAYASRFLELISGSESSSLLVEKLRRVTVAWGKEPTIVRKDIRGFITNRIMYAMYREAFYLVENGYATIEDVDSACKNDGGTWMSFCGLFRYMDLTGLQAYHTVMKDLFPTLSNETKVPKLISRIAEQGGNGTSNGRGFYTYTPDEAREWDEAFRNFSLELYKLTEQYIDLGKVQKDNNERS